MKDLHYLMIFPLFFFNRSSAFSVGTVDLTSYPDDHFFGRGEMGGADEK
jgi:hypothetical protein